MGEFAAGLGQGFTSELAKQQQRQQGEELKKFQLKMFKQQLDVNEKKQSAMKLVQDFLKGVPAHIKGGLEEEPTQLTGGTPGVPPITPAQPSKGGISELLSQEPLAALRSGFASMGDIQKSKNRELMQQFLPGGQPGGQQGGGVPPRVTTTFDERGGRVSIAPGKVTWQDISDTQKQAFSEQGQPIQGMTIEKNAKIPLAQLNNIIDEETGKPPKFGITDKEVTENPERYKVKEKEVSGESAGKLAMMKAARTGLPTIENLLFDEDGSPDYTNVGTMWANIPGTEGAQLSHAYELGIQATTRVETGAAMLPSELDNSRKRFQPKPWDSEKVIKAKWEVYQGFINGTIKLLDPNKRFEEQEKSFNKKLDAEIKRRSTGKTKPSLSLELPKGIPKGSTQIGTSGGNPVYETPDGKRLMVE